MKKVKKIPLMTVCLLLAIVFTVTGTVAYIFTQTDAVKNTFTAPEISNIPDEEFDKVIKENVKIDVGNPNGNGVKSFVRAQIVINWQEIEAGVDNVLSTIPAETADYVLNLNLNNEKDDNPDIAGRWVKHTDGYYYFTQPVDPDASTELLITSAYQTGEAMPGYRLHIAILSQSIQAVGTTDDGVMPVQQVWGVTIANDQVTDYTAS